LVGKNAPTTDDNKDRGIEFRWHDGTSAKRGFFGFDDSTGKFTFIPDASNSSEVFSGSLGEINANITWDNVIDKPTFVNSLTGTPNEINVTSTTGAIVISLPSTAAINISGTSAGWTTPRKITLSGDLEGNVIVDGGSNVTLNANIIANAVSLGTDTTGDYVANIAAGTGITITNGSGEQSQPIIAVTNNTYDSYGSAATAEANAAADASTKAATAYNNATTYVNNQLSSFAVDSLSDVTINTSLANSYLKFNGSTWANDQIDLSTDTTGNYVQSLIAGDGIIISNNSGEGSTPTISVDISLNDLNNVNIPLPGDNQVLIYDADTSSWIAKSTGELEIPAGVAYTETFGNGVDTEFLVTHGLDTLNPFVVVFKKNSSEKFESLYALWEVFSNNIIKLYFESPPGLDEIKVSIFGDVSSASLVITSLSQIPEVSISSSSSGKFLYKDGSYWVDKAAYLNDLADVNGTNTAVANQFLKYNGNSWVGSSINEVNNINDIQDVTITSAANGEILQYNGSAWVNSTLPSKEPTGFMDRTSSQISMSGRTFTISPTSGNFSIWCGGRKYIKASSESVQIDDISGLYYIYYNSSGILSYKTTYFDFENEAPVAYIYWNQGGNTHHFFADERHGVAMDWATHEYLHRTRGAAIANGFGIAAITDGSGNNNSHAQISLAAGTFFDEDIEVQIIDQATPNSNTWEQVLSPIAKIPVFYKSGNAWVKDQATNYPLKYDSGRSMYNSYSGGTWSSTQISNNRWGISWLIATNNLNEPVIAILGQQEYSSSNLAEDAVWEDLNLDGFPIFEFRPLHKIIYYTSNTYTNQPKTAITAVWDLRKIASTGGSVPTTPVSDHGSMIGLLDDDHTQYLNTARHDAHDHGAAFANTSNATLGGNLVVTGNFSVNGSMIATSDVTVSGNLTVNGSTVTINSETLVVEDKTIELGTSLSPSNTTADGSGIIIPDGTTNKTFIWVNSTSSWTLSEHLNLAINKVIKMNGIEVLSATNYIGHAASASQATIASAVTANSVTPSMLQEGPAKAAFRSEILTINSDSYTLIISDLSKLILMNNTSPMTVTIPSESNVAFDNGDRIDVTRYGTGSLTFAAQAGVTLKSTPGLKLRAQYSTATLTKLGTNEWLIVGDLAA
jgi:cytoskeletal protein CcmA (bactofilin family)